MGDGCGMGRDHTIYAKAEGWVKFTYDPIKKYQTVSVIDHNPNPNARKWDATSVQINN